MSNKFDAANYPEGVPDTLIIGDRWLWKRTDLTDYPVASYSLKWVFRLEGTGATEIEVTATETDGYYYAEVASATTANYTAGTYQWQCYVTRTSDSQRLTLDSGTTEAVANRDAATTEPRSHAARVLAAIEATIEGTASKELANYSVDGVAIGRRSIEELMRMRDGYKAEVEAEIEDQRIEAGLKARGRKVRVAFDAEY